MSKPLPAHVQETEAKKKKGTEAVSLLRSRTPPGGRGHAELAVCLLLGALPNAPSPLATSQVSESKGQSSVPCVEGKVQGKMRWKDGLLEGEVGDVDTQGGQPQL